jgi:hypothetical protein
MDMPEYLRLSAESELRVKSLFLSAHRIADLLRDSSVVSNEALAACLDDLLGAVYTLIFAVHYGFDDRPQPLTVKDINAVLVRAQDMAIGRVRIEGKWTAGFFFSNALFRIASVYHRSLKTVTGKNGWAGPLAKIAKRKYKAVRGRGWKDKTLERIHEEVNGLKHDPKGILRGRKTEFQHAEKAVDELLDLLEALK